MRVSPCLVDVLERCYVAFADVPVPKRLDVSPFKDADIGRRVLARPLRELSDDDIGPYAASSTLTVLGDDDYRHFIPRILELSVSSGGWPGADPPIIASHLDRAGWSQWSMGQRAVIQEFFDAAYEWSIRAKSDEPADAELWLCGNILIGRPLDKMLDAWRRDTTPDAAWRLADLHGDWVESNDSNERLGYWEDVSEDIWIAIGRWLLDPATERQLRAALPTIGEYDRCKLERELDVIDRRTAH